MANQFIVCKLLGKPLSCLHHLGRVLVQYHEYGGIVTEEGGRDAWLVRF